MAAPASMGVVSAIRGPHKTADRTFFPSVTFIGGDSLRHHRHAATRHFIAGTHRVLLIESSAAHASQSTSKSDSAARSLLLARLILEDEGEQAMTAGRCLSGEADFSTARFTKA